MTSRFEHTKAAYLRLSSLVFLYHFTMFNPYTFQIQQQTGMSEREIRQSSRPAQLTLAAAQEHGFETVDEYEEAIREYIYG